MDDTLIAIKQQIGVSISATNPARRSTTKTRDALEQYRDEREHEHTSERAKLY